MKILFVCDYFPPFAPGGAEWSSYYLAKALIKKGHEPIILTPNYGSLPFEEKGEGFKIIRYPFPVKLKPGQKTLRYFFNTHILYYLYSCFWIIRSCLKEKTAIIHLQSRLSLPGAVLAKFFLNLPLVLTIRDTVLFCPTGVCLQEKKLAKEYISFSHFWRKCSPKYIGKYLKPKTKLAYIYARLNLAYFWLDNFIKRKLLKYCSRIIFISQSLLEIYLKVNLVSRRKTAVVYNLPPADIKKPNQKQVKDLKRKYNLEDKKIVLYVGRLTLGKGVYDLLDAAEIVHQKEKKITFLLVGKGKLNISSSDLIKIIPSVPHKKLFKFYQAADLVVVPTRGIEPFGRVPFEAAMFKKPVVATKSGGLREQIIDKETGYLVPRKEPQELAKAILKILKNRELELKMGKRNYQFIKKKFNEDKIVNQLMSIYQSLR